MKTNEELKEQLGDSLCEYCPWHNGEIGHAPGMTCEGLCCDDALDNFLDDVENCKRVVEICKPIIEKAKGGFEPPSS